MENLNWCRQLLLKIYFPMCLVSILFSGEFSFFRGSVRFNLLSGTAREPFFGESLVAHRKRREWTVYVHIFFLTLREIFVEHECNLKVLVCITAILFGVSFSRVFLFPSICIKKKCVLQLSFRYS